MTYNTVENKEILSAESSELKPSETSAIDKSTIDFINRWNMLLDFAKGNPLMMKRYKLNTL